jgi:hypothetical protein
MKRWLAKKQRRMQDAHLAYWQAQFRGHEDDVRRLMAAIEARREKSHAV